MKKGMRACRAHSKFSSSPLIILLGCCMIMLIRPVFRPARNQDPHLRQARFRLFGFRVSPVLSQSRLNSITYFKWPFHWKPETLALRHSKAIVAETMSRAQSSLTVIQWVIDTRPLWPSALKTKDLTSAVSALVIHSNLTLMSYLRLHVHSHFSPRRNNLLS